MPDESPEPEPYPPSRHAMRLLEVEVETDADGDLRGRLAARPEIERPSGGPRIGALGVFLDGLGGLRSLAAAAPDWAFTADLSIHLLPTGPVDGLVADVEVLRRGRRTLIVETVLSTTDGRPAGTGTLSFTIVGRPAAMADVVIEQPPGRRELSPLPVGEARPDDYATGVGVRSPRPGLAVVELVPEVANTVGALHGGVHTLMADVASSTLGEDLLGPGAETVDVHLAFLELGRRGPLQAEAVAIGPAAPDGDRLTVEVRLTDADGLLCSYATTEVARP